jgi:hypothetical protein
LGEGELDGGRVLKEGDAVAAFDAGIDGIAVVLVGIAIMVAEESLGATLLTAGFDVAALAWGAEGVSWLGIGRGCGLVRFRHCGSFRAARV